jgi:hypothetical protein
MSPAEKDAEFHYRVAERISLFTLGEREPTKFEFYEARAEAFKWLEDAEKSRCRNIQQRE